MKVLTKDFTIEELLDEALHLISISGDCKNLLGFNRYGQEWIEATAIELEKEGYKNRLSEDFHKEMIRLQNYDTELTQEIINKLIDDKLIRKNAQTVSYLKSKDYFVTAEGRLFMGYVKQKETNNKETNRIREHDYQIKVLSAVVAFGAVSSSLYYLFEFLKWYFGY